MNFSLRLLAILNLYPLMNNNKFSTSVFERTGHHGLRQIK